jgi:mannose-6-phosphate isomerase-like protein (cupin superfamily)
LIARIAMKHEPVSFEDKFDKFTDHFSPRIIAQMNDYHFKLVKFEGDFIWHRHADSDEVFIVIDGQMSIDFRDGRADLEAGEMIVVPKGVEHKPFAKDECKLMLVEPAGTINTGDETSDMTSEDNVWI